MLHLGRGLEAVADELAPLLKVGRLTEINRVVLQRLPLHEQAVAAWLLDRTPELQTDAALRTLKQRNRLLHPGLERLFQAGCDLELRNLQHHSALLACSRALVSLDDDLPAIVAATGPYHDKRCFPAQDRMNDPMKGHI